MSDLRSLEARLRTAVDALLVDSSPSEIVVAMTWLLAKMVASCELIRGRMFVTDWRALWRESLAEARAVTAEVGLEREIQARLQHREPAQKM